MSRQSIHDRIMSRKPNPSGGESPEAETARRTRSPMRKRGLVCGVLGAVVAGGTALAVSFYPGLSDLAAGSATAPSQASDPAPADGDTPFHKHVRKAGVGPCGGVFPALGQLVTKGSEYAVQTQWDNQAAHPNSLQALVGQDYDTPGYKAKAVGVIFASAAGESCEGSMVRIAPFKGSCRDVIQRLPQGSSRVAALSGIPLYRLGGAGGQTMVLQTAESCVVVSVARMAGSPER